MKSTTLYLIRHGETDWNFNKRVQGRQDTALNEAGVQQARRLAEELKDTKFSAIYASPLQRAYHTAKHLADEIKTDSRLQETCYGVYEGLLWSDFLVHVDDKLKQYELLDLHEKGHFKFHESAESYFEVYIRAKECLDEIVQKHPGEQIAVATHGGLIKSVLSILEEIDPRHIDVSNVGYVVMEVEKACYRSIRYSGIYLQKGAL